MNMKRHIPLQFAIITITLAECKVHVAIQPNETHYNYVKIASSFILPPFVFSRKLHSSSLDNFYILDQGFSFCTVLCTNNMYMSDTTGNY